MEAGPDVSFRSDHPINQIVARRDGKQDDSDISKTPIDVSAYFYQLTEILDKDYVDPIKDDRGLAIGAIRGMVQYLMDPYSLFYKPEQMKAVSDLQLGTYSGIGVEIRYDFGSTDEPDVTPFRSAFRLPSVIVASVAPKSPADEAGIKPGDRIVRVNDKWAPSYKEMEEIQVIRKSLDEGKTTADEFEESIDRFRTMFENSTSAGRTADEVSTGSAGKIRVVWRSAGEKNQSATMDKRLTKMGAVTVDGDTIHLKFFTGAAPLLKEAVVGRSKLTFDLRDSTLGDYSAMRECLEILAPQGQIGVIQRNQVGKPRAVSVKVGSSALLEISLVVDSSTRGAAQAFAHALVGSGAAMVVQGTLEETAPWIETVKLPDGSGYVLRTGTFVSLKEDAK